MNTRLITIIIICLLIGSAVTYAITQNQIRSLQSTINQIQTEVNQIPDLKQQINQLTSEKQTLQQQVTSLQNQRDTLSGEKTSLQTQINSLNTQITLKNTQIANLNQQITQLKDQNDLDVLAISFSRTQDTSTLLQLWIGKANHTVKMMMYFITEDELADSLITAKNRGVDIDIVVDEYCLTVTGSEYQRLRSAGIDVRSDNYSGTMHHKVMIIDGAIVVTGSYNWSSAAEDSNYENIIIIRGNDIADQYLSEFNRIWSNTVSVNLTASFTYSVSGLTVTYEDTSIDDFGVVSWYWSFGDSHTSTSKNPSHTYEASGTYTTTLTVRDADSHTSTSSKSVTVTNNQPANGPFWGSVNSNKYHYPSCYWATQIHSDNLIIFSSSMEARAAGYIPCSICDPP